MLHIHASFRAASKLVSRRIDVAANNTQVSPGQLEVAERRSGTGNQEVPARGTVVAKVPE